MDLEPSQSFGPYRIVRWLARGAMGVIYHATDAEGRDVALKMMGSELAMEGNARQRFLQEAKSVARLQHRNIVVVYGSGVVDDCPYMAMELLQGTSLEALMREAPTMALDRKLDIVVQLCDALQFAHDHGIIHRDVKPANIWVLDDGSIKLLDFGIAHMSNSSLTRFGDVVGSVAYMSPEQIAGSEIEGGEVDGRSDVFAAGAVLYELLAGRRAFIGANLPGVMHKILHEPPPPIRSLAPGVPSEIEAIVAKALEKAPDARYTDAADFGTELRLARNHASATIVAPPGTASPSGQPATPPTPAGPSVDAWLATAFTQAAAVVRRQARGFDAALLRRRPWVFAAPAVALVVVLGIWSATRTPAPTYQLEIRSVPDGAAISIDGADTGRRTPSTLSLDVVPRRLRMALPGYAPVDAPFEARFDAGRASVEYTLRRLVLVTSEPAGASIILEGRDTGLVTPAEVALPSTLPVSVELWVGGRLHGRGAIATADLVELRIPRAPIAAVPHPSTVSGADSEITPKAQEIDGPRVAVSLRITGNYDYAVSGCGVSSPAADVHTLEVQAPCRVRVRAPAYLLDTSMTVSAATGQQEIAVPQLARVQLRSRFEWCTVILNGHAVGAPPVEMDLASGTYVATIQCPDKTYATAPILIQPGRSIRRLDEFLR